MLAIRLDKEIDGGSGPPGQDPWTVTVVPLGA